jgi:hypothetical protein
MYEVTEQVSIDTQEAASNIQRLFRGFHSRAAAQIERDEELIFIGMKPARPHLNDLEHDLDQVHRRLFLLCPSQRTGRGACFLLSNYPPNFDFLPVCRSRVRLPPLASILFQPGVFEAEGRTEIVQRVVR